MLTLFCIAVLLVCLYIIFWSEPSSAVLVGALITFSVAVLALSTNFNPPPSSPPETPVMTSFSEAGIVKVSATDIAQLRDGTWAMVVGEEDGSTSTYKCNENLRTPPSMLCATLASSLESKQEASPEAHLDLIITTYRNDQLGTLEDVATVEAILP